MQNLKILPLPLNATELKKIAEIEKSTFSSPYSLQSLKRELSLPFSKIFIVKENNQTIAYCIVWTLKEEAEIHRIAVTKEKRGKGTGKLLLKTVLQELKNSGVRKVLLEVNEKNLPAVHLYLSCGFKITGKRKNYYGKGENALLMETLL